MKGGTVLPLDRDKQPPRLMDLMFWVPQISKFLPLRPAGQWCCWGRTAMSQDQGLHGPPFLFDFTHSVGLACGVPGLVPVGLVTGLWFQEGVLASRSLLLIGAAFFPLGW